MLLAYVYYILLLITENKPRAALSEYGGKSFISEHAVLNPDSEISRHEI